MATPQLTIPQNPNLISVETYNSILKQLIQNLLAQIHHKTLNLSSSLDSFHQLIQSRLDPPLESIWFYVALIFQAQNSSKFEILERVNALKDLFQLISACSSACECSKSIALLAPLIFELYKVVVDLLKVDVWGSKRGKKVVREVKSLIDNTLGYINVCHSECSGEGSDNRLVTPFRDLVSIWVGEEEVLQSFMPLITGEVLEGIVSKNFDVNYLSGVVIMEAFLLKMCVSFRLDGMSRLELEKELRSWAVGSITAFQNSYFFELLLRMLLETNLPVASLVDDEDQAALRKILYDATVLVDYSFLSSERVINLSADHFRSLATRRLIVAYEAIESFRVKGDHKKALSYSDAFSSSCLPSEIIKWVRSCTGIDEKATQSIGSSPKALIMWLLDLEDQGLGMIDDTLLNYHAKLASDISLANEKMSSKMESANLESDLGFYIDNKGEEGDDDGEDSDVNESVKAAFIAAAQIMRSGETEGRKRKESKNGKKKKKKIEFLKYGTVEDSSSRRKRSKADEDDDNLASACEVENPDSDEDLDE